MKYFVSRQIYWPDGTHMVEIANGGLDYANPDILVPSYRGEGKEYSNPKEAVEVAQQIKKLWQETDKENDIYIAAGSTGGMTMPFEPMSDIELEVWADKQFYKLPKCDECGDILPVRRFGHFIYHDMNFCSEYCAEKFEEKERVLNEEVE